MKDLFGKAILDYQTKSSPENIMTETSISEQDEMLVSYLFRRYDEMPPIEQKALDLAKGKILDVGCGAGSHSLYLQDERHLDVTSIDISEKAIVACKLRGLTHAISINVLDLVQERYDSILLLMNGTGIFGKLNDTDLYLQKLKSLLNVNGQILIDSSDIIYMYDEEEHEVLREKSTPLQGKYYGELVFDISYKGEDEDSFDWLYLDFETLKNCAYRNGLQCEMILEGEHYDYLAKLSFI